MAIKISGSTIIDDGRSLVNVGVSTISGDLHVGTGVTVFSTTGIVSATAYHHSDGTFIGFRQDVQENLYAGTSAGAASDSDTSFNIAFGCNAGTALNAGDKNILMGCQAGKSLTSGSRNIIFGVNGACANLSIHSDNVFIGSYTGLYQASSHNVAIGNNAAIKCFTGGSNVAIGRMAGCGGSGGALTATSNVFLGKYAGRNITDGDQNIFLGTYAGGGQDLTGDNLSLIHI